MTAIITDRLTNTEIMNATDQMLTSIQRQVKFIMKQEMVRKGCPNCGEPHNMPEAADVTVDDFDFGNHGDDRVGKCRKCHRTLIFTLPMFGDWHWRLDPKEAA